MLVVLVVFLFAGCSFKGFNLASPKNKEVEVTDLDADTILRLLDIRTAKFTIPYSETIQVYAELHERESVKKEVLSFRVTYPRDLFPKESYEHSVAIIPTREKSIYDVIYKNKESATKQQLNLTDHVSKFGEGYFTSVLRTDKLDFSQDGEAILFVMVLNKIDDVSRPWPGGPLNERRSEELIKFGHDIVVVFKIKTEI